MEVMELMKYVADCGSQICSLPRMSDCRERCLVRDICDNVPNEVRAMEAKNQYYKLKMEARLKEESAPVKEYDPEAVYATFGGIEIEPIVPERKKVWRFKTAEECYDGIRPGVWAKGMDHMLGMTLPDSLQDREAEDSISGKELGAWGFNPEDAVFDYPVKDCHE